MEVHKNFYTALRARRRPVEGLELSGIPEYPQGDRTRYRRLLEALRGHSEIVTEKEG